MALFGREAKGVPSLGGAGLVSLGRRVAHGVDLMAVSLAMQVIARVAERKLLSAAAHQSRDEVA